MTERTTYHHVYGQLGERCTGRIVHTEYVLDHDRVWILPANLTFITFVHRMSKFKCVAAVGSSFRHSIFLGCTRRAATSVHGAVLVRELSSRAIVRMPLPISATTEMSSAFCTRVSSVQAALDTRTDHIDQPTAVLGCLVHRADGGDKTSASPERHPPEFLVKMRLCCVSGELRCSRT